MFADWGMPQRRLASTGCLPLLVVAHCALDMHLLKMMALALTSSCSHVGASAGPSATAAEEALKLLPGAYFDIQQGIDEHGLPIDSPVDAKPSEPGLSLALCLCVHVLSTQAVPPAVGNHKMQGRRTVVVMFIGGVTYAEISALRFLSTRPDLDCDFVIATTKLMMALH